MRVHKIIYKYLEDIENYVFDAKQEMAKEEGRSLNVEILGVLNVKQIFNIKGAKGKVDMVAGSKVEDGKIQKDQKFRLIRNDRVI